MSNILGIVSPENDTVIVEGLMDYRPIPAISFLGRYRLIDFAISNFSNSHIDHIKVFVKNQPRSLIEQLGSGRHYGINSKRGRLQILYNDLSGISALYNTDINTYLRNMEFIEEADEKYVAITPGYQICAVDYRDVVKQHEEEGADVTVLYKQTDRAKERFIGCPALTLDNGYVIESVTNLGKRKNAAISMETYVMAKDMFVKLVREAHAESSAYSLRDILRDKIGKLRIMGYSYKGYFACINSMNSYYKTSMELLDYETAKDLFRPDWPIYTKTNDSAPAFYGEDAKVEHSVIANGCRIEGTVINSALGRGVIVEKGAIVKDAILLPFSHIGKDCHVEYAVVDKWAKVNRVKEVKGTSSYDVAYIRRRDKI